MARPGKVPKPIEQKIHDGTLRPRDVQTPLVIGGREEPKPSGYLSALEKKHFRRLVKELHDAHILDKADRGMVELTAIEEANIEACNLAMERDGEYIEHYSDRGAVNMVEHPAKASRAKSVEKLRHLYGELGIGPSSRARMKGLGIGAVTAETRKRDIPGLDAARKLRVVGDE